MKATDCTDCQAADVVDLSGPDGSVPRTKKPQATGGITKFKAVCAFVRCGTCSKTLMSLIDRQYGQELKPEEQATDPLAGGMMQGYQCGMLWGAALAAGAQAYQVHGPGPQAEVEAINASHQLVESFRARNKQCRLHRIILKPGWQIRAL